ncbi:FAD-dependent monooxygenase [Actinomadura rudentiformis]|uniref:NAD(P)-binding protein n=1 Tax=Actinomadura rudentiformis TaxID=359158 RepID=A0A6H9YWE3_9ACTN|nr:FAD-dependent monooxygenase [Actinomadura rudentiformis]KAB2348301.1 NAD(P)-binding protein [Actinomadura rudentiformis]
MSDAQPKSERRGGGRQRTAIVAGGGIGGLAAAIALINRGWQVDVLEKAPAFGEVGAGLSLWPNGVRALDALGLGEQVRARALVETQGGIRDTAGRWLSRTDVEELDRRFGPLVMTHRADLLEILRDAVPTGALHVDTEVEDVRVDGAQVEVVHGDGVARADLLVGADGINSRVRHAVWPDAPEPVYAGYTAWRLVVDPDQKIDAGGETWGRGLRVGFAPLPDGRVYLFGVANAPTGRHSPGSELAELRRTFATWHEPIPALMEAATEDAVMRHDIYELPPLATFVSGRVALLGDAAHAMTPNMGQGANQALEDAVTLAAFLDRNATIESALAAYDANRRPRTQMIAKRSHRIGVVAQWTWGPAVRLRETALRIIPASSMFRALTPVLNWQPPS